MYVDAITQNFHRARSMLLVNEVSESDWKELVNVYSAFENTACFDSCVQLMGQYWLFFKLLNILCVYEDTATGSTSSNCR